MAILNDFSNGGWHTNYLDPSWDDSHWKSQASSIFLPLPPGSWSDHQAPAVEVAVAQFGDPFGNLGGIKNSGVSKKETEPGKVEACV